MADADVPITAGTGTKIDTRTVGAGTDEHRQVICIGDPVTAANVATADAANGLDVDVTRLPALPAGTNNIGDVDVLTLPNVAQATAANLNATVAQGAAAAQTNAWYQRPRKFATYSAVYKGTTRPYQLTSTFTANTRKQYATIFHAASATKTVRIRRCQVEILLDTTAAAEINIDLVRLTAATTPATGNPAITPAISDNADAAAEATCLALPTTAGTEGATWSSRYLALGITGTASTGNPPVYWPEYEMVNGGTGDDEGKFPAIRAGVAEGWAIVLDSTTAAVIWARVSMQFVEE